MTMAEATVTEINTLDELSRLQTILATALPGSIALHGHIELLLPRILAHGKAKTQPLTLRAFDNSIILSSFNPKESDPLPDRFTVLFFHPACPDGLAATLYTSLERESPPAPTSDPEPDPEHLAHVVRQLDALLRHAAHDPLAAHLSTGPYGPGRLKLSSVAAASHRALRACGITVSSPAVYTKLLIAREATRHLRTAATERPLPAGLAFDAVRPPDYAGVMATNELVRSAAALDAMRGLGLRDASSGKLVAWAFWAINGSLRTVFVVPEMRGQGLARTLLAHMLESVSLGGGSDASRGGVERAFVATDVAPDNVASLRLMRGLGARDGWPVVWPEVDLGRLGVR